MRPEEANQDIAGVLRTRELVEALDADERLLLCSILGGYSLVRASVLLGSTLDETVHLKARVMRKLSAVRTADLVRTALHAGLDPAP